MNILHSSFRFIKYLCDGSTTFIIFLFFHCGDRIYMSEAEYIVVS